MRASTSIWSKYVNRLFGTPQTTAPRRTARRRAALGHGFEPLEDRTVLSVSFGSALSIGNDTGSSGAFDVATDQAGNSYLAGSFKGTVDFDPAATHAGDTDILTARGSGDAFVAKYAPDNSLVWARRMGGDASQSAGVTDVGSKIKVDSGGSVYVVGAFIGSADFGSTILSSVPSGEADGFVAKLDASGTFQWAKNFGDGGNGVGIDAGGNAYALSVGSGGTYSVHKFTPAGTAVWTRSVITRGVFGARLAVDPAGNVFIGGDFHGTVDFDPGPKTKYVSSSASYTSYSGFVLKLTTAGKFGWVSPFVGQTVGSTYGSSYVFSIARDGSGNIIVGGGYNGPVDFNPGAGTTTLPSSGRGFITKLNGSGALVWAKALESDNSTFVRGLAVDAAGSIYATGDFYGTVDFDPGAGSYSRTTAGAGDVFVMQLTAAGNFGWAETFGASNIDAGMGIAVDSAGVVHIAGQYSGTVDFDPDPLATYSLTASGTLRSGFRLRLRQA